MFAVVSALVVAMDLMYKAKGIMHKGQKKVVLLMPANSPMDPEELESTQAQVRIRQAIRCGHAGCHHSAGNVCVSGHWCHQ